MAPYENPGKSNDWYTPAYIFQALGVHFDMDVAAPKEGPRHVPADSWISEKSLTTKWQGFIWMNPPFGDQLDKIAWLHKFFDHGDGIALMPDRSSTPWWQDAATRADAICFVRGKIKFERPDGTVGGSPGYGTCLFGAGPLAVASLVQSKLGFVYVGN